MDWKEIARSLPIGRSRKVPHCTAEPTAHVHHDVDRIRLFCHRCRTHEYEYIDQHSLAEIAAQRRSVEQGIGTEVRMPTSTKCITEADKEGLLWVLRGGLTPEAAKSHGFRWHAGLHKVLIPIRDSIGRYTGTLARSVDGSAPKYKMLNGSPKYHMPKNVSGPLVLTEDVLSAVAYNRAGYCGVAILGTSLDALTAVHLTEGGRHEVLISLDPDKAGLLAVGRVRKALGLSDVTVGVIRPRRDPKYLPRQELQQLVQEQLTSNA